MLILWENTAATVAQHAEFPGAARAFMAQPRVCFTFTLFAYLFLDMLGERSQGRGDESRKIGDPVIIGSKENLAILKKRYRSLVMETYENTRIATFFLAIFADCSKNI